jgi:hypothetical protein
VSTKQAHLSMSLADPKKRGAWAFQELGSLDLSDAPQLPEQLAAEEVPWYGCIVQRCRDGGWTVEFSTAATEEELHDIMHLNSIKRVLEHLSESRQRRRQPQRCARHLSGHQTGTQISLCACSALSDNLLEVVA